LNEYGYLEESFLKDDVYGEVLTFRGPDNIMFNVIEFQKKEEN
jgi:hypothetical protein